MTARSVLWAFFLASSWTWCIGMFLPILLVRDFGPWGFVAFAVPNVLGAAAMGWVLSADSSRRLISAHRSAVRGFALVTIAFQVFFVAWQIGRTGQWWAVAAAAALGALPLWRRESGRLALAAGVWTISAGALAWELLRGTPAPMPPPALPVAHVAPLALVCILGFSFCPYLDPTFHEARQRATDRAARVAFGLGFGVLFLSMILGTCIYAGSALTGDDWQRAPWSPARVVPLILTLHIAPQATFTILAHLWCLIGVGAVADTPSEPRRTTPLLVVYTLLAAVAFGAFRLGAEAEGWVSAFAVSGLFAGEVAYRTFMVFYGLFFPAYVLLCVIPPRGRPLAPPSRATFRVFAFACGVALPFYWMGFIQRQTWWLLPGVAVVLLARPLAVRAAALHAPAARG